MIFRPFLGGFLDSGVLAGSTLARRANLIDPADSGKKHDDPHEYSIEL